jgi:hypothetical protein
MRIFLACTLAVLDAASPATSDDALQPPRKLQLLPQLLRRNLPLPEAEGFQVPAMSHGAARATPMLRQSLPAPAAAAPLAKHPSGSAKLVTEATEPRLPEPRARSIVMGEKPGPLARLGACLVYLMPVMDGFQYGMWIYQNVPFLGKLAYRFQPIVYAFQSVPFLPLVLFIGLASMSNSMGLSRFVRFNIQQSILLDICLILPYVFAPVTKFFPMQLQIIGTNMLWYCVVGIVSYAILSNLNGLLPNRVPFLSEAASAGISRGQF